MTPDQLEDYEERAAIMEHDGGMTREAAEAAARADVQRRAESAVRRDDPPAASALSLW